MTDKVKQAIIDKRNQLIEADVYDNADLTELRPVFVLSDGAKAYIDGVEQISGETAHDFSRPVIYKIVSQNGKTIKYYEVTIMVVPNSHGTDFVTYTQNTKLLAGIHKMPKSITIAAGIRFVIDAGANLILPSDASITVNFEAEFIAIGTKEQPIKFFASEENGAEQH